MTPSNIIGLRHRDSESGSRLLPIEPVEKKSLFAAKFLNRDHIQRSCCDNLINKVPNLIRS